MRKENKTGTLGLAILIISAVWYTGKYWLFFGAMIAGEAIRCGSGGGDCTNVVITVPYDMMLPAFVYMLGALIYFAEGFILFKSTSAIDAAICITFLVHLAATMILYSLLSIRLISSAISQEMMVALNGAVAAILLITLLFLWIRAKESIEEI